MPGPSDQSFFASTLRKGASPRNFDNPYAQHIPTYRAMNVIATNIAALRLLAWTGPPEDGGERAVAPEVDALLNRPNPYMSRQALILTTVLHLLGTGESWWQLRDSAGNQLTSEREIPRWIMLASGEDVALDTVGHSARRHMNPLMGGWTWKDRRNEEVLEPVSNLMIKVVDPKHPLRGMAPLGVGRMDLDTDWQAGVFNNSFFRNSAVPDGILSTDLPVPDASRDSMRKQFQQRYGGAWNAHGTPFLSHGIKYSRLGSTQSEMEFEKGRRFNREMVSMLFGVPESEMGHTGDTKYWNGITGNLGLWGGVLFPIMEMIESVLNDPVYGLAQRFGRGRKIYLAFDRTRVKQLMDRISERIEQAVQLWKIGVPLQVIINRLDLALPDGLPGADQSWIPMQMQTLEEGLRGDDFTSDSDTSAASADWLSSELGDGETLGYRKKWISREVMVRSVSGRVRKTWDKYTAQSETQITAWMREYRRAMLDQMDSAAKTASLRDVESFTQEKAAADDLLLTAKQWKARLVARMRKVYRAAVVSAAGTVEMELGGLQHFDIGSPSIAGFLKNLAVKVTRVETTVRNALRTTLGIGLQQGETVAQLKDRIKQTMNVATSRAKTIARTEAGFAVNGGRMEVMKAEGVAGTEWSTFLDAATRDSHVKVNGERRPLGKKFSNGLRQPLEVGAPPEEVINCRCVAITLEPEEMKDAQPKSAPSRLPGDAEGRNGLSHAASVLAHLAAQLPGRGGNGHPHG